MRDKSIAVTPGDKDSTVVVLDKKDYIQKLQDMVDDGIKEGIYETSKDSTLSDHKISMTLCTDILESLILKCTKE